MTDQNLTDQPTIYLVAGKLRRPHGLGGEMIMDVITDFPERLHRGTVVFVGDQHTPQKIRACRAYGTNMLVSLEGYHTQEQAGELRNQYLYVRSDLIPPLPDGEYYHHQLIGLRVISDEGQELGSVEHILETGANDVYIIRSASGAEILLPAIESVILGIDLNAGEMHVHLLPGLLPE